MKHLNRTMVTVLIKKPNAQAVKHFVPANKIWQSNIPFTSNKRFLQDNLQAMLKGQVAKAPGIQAWIVQK